MFVKWSDAVLGEEELRTAFVRFGQIKDFRLHHRKWVKNFSKEVK